MRQVTPLCLAALLSLGLASSSTITFANAPETPQTLLIAFDGFDDDGGDSTLGDAGDGSEETMDGTSTSSSSEEPEEVPDEGFHTGYNPDDE